MEFIKQNFSIDQAYKQATSVVLKHFFFFLVAMLLCGAAVLVFLVAIGVIDFAVWHQAFGDLLQAGHVAATRATGLVAHSDHDWYGYIGKYVPAAFARHLQPAVQCIQDLKNAPIRDMQGQLSNVIKILIPSAIALKLFVDLIMIGWIKNCFAALDNQDMKFHYLFSQIRYLLNYVVVNLMVHAVVLVGCFAFVVPGVYLYQRLRFAKYFVIDQDMNMFAALGASWKATCKNTLHLTGYSIFSMIISAAAHAVFVLMLFLRPLNAVADVSVYRQLANKQ